MNTKLIRSHDALMKGFAVAEMVTASLEHPPTSVTVSNLGPITVDLHFHRMPEHVIAAAAQYGVDPVEIRDFAGSKGAVETEALIEHDGVAVRCWSLTPATAEEVAA
ncbi:hypothetical protein [Streptomyces sp. CC208A]|uniref:hypothetical protein n=1 Tax=Streptomyces sp. CC208A TaxID=3044573 RepID=UPI0024A879B0|nr:hypothetical protein [Streptomyces sp. CC208A]